jgi:glycosyltransferase involved in cell wall biosynthesis
MPKRALIFFPHNPYPPRSGAHQRCMAMLKAFRVMGYEVILFSSNLFTDTSWTVESVEQLEKDLSIKVEIYEGDLYDYQYIAYAGMNAQHSVNFSMYIPPGLRRSFRRVFEKLQPDVVLINYSLWGGLALDKSFESAIRIIEAHDLFTQNLKMTGVLSRLSIEIPIQLNKVLDELLEEDFYSSFDIDTVAEEYWVYDQYDYTIAISPSETKLIQEHSKQTKVEYIPVTFNPNFVENIYEGDPVFVIGPNQFNLQGYCYFVKRVLPVVQQQLSKFKLQVIGSSCQHLAPVEGIELLGFVPNLSSLYATTKFAICPLIGGTGQQVKIVEAMAHGVPVIALKNTAESSPIEHGINGFIAENANEFAEYIVKLFSNSELCQQMGESARKTIAQHFSEQVLIEKLSVILNKTNVPQLIEPTFPKIVVDGVFFQFNKSGIARVWRSLLEEWSKADFAQYIVVLDRGHTAPQIPGIRYRSIQPYSYGQTAVDSEVLQSICDDERANLFISSYYTTPTTTPSVFMAYDMIPEIIGSNLDDIGWKEKHYGIFHALKYITISESTARDLVKFFPHISETQVRVAHCGIEPIFLPATALEISQFKQKFNITKPYFLLVGERTGVDGYKNAIFFFQALSQLPDRQDFMVLCVGGKPELEPDLAALAEGISTQVLFLEDEELKAAYSGAIALIYPSLYEGFGLPIAEAMACGCPVITGRHSSIPEVAGEAALYIEPEEIDNMVSALIDVCRPEVRQGLIQKGFEQAQKFSWAKMAAIVAEVLQQTSEEIRAKDVRISPIWAEFRRLHAQIQNPPAPPPPPPAPEPPPIIEQPLQLSPVQKKLQRQLDRVQVQLQQTQHRLQETESLVAAMETSKFWKLRSLWFRIKRLFGLPVEE